MLPWKILGWIALSILIASVIAVSAAGYALYSTGSDAVHALAAPPLSGPGPGGTDAGAACAVQCQGDGGQALITAAMGDPGAPYGCTPADLSYMPCRVHLDHVRPAPVSAVVATLTPSVSAASAIASWSG